MVSHHVMGGRTRGPGAEGARNRRRHYGCRVPGQSSRATFDVVVVGAGHNGLVAAAVLARAGKRVLVLERAGTVGGAAVSTSPFAGIEARLSRYSYLVSLFPRELLAELGVDVELRRRRISSYTPCGDTGVLIGDEQDDAPTRASLRRTRPADRRNSPQQRHRRRRRAVPLPED